MRHLDIITAEFKMVEEKIKANKVRLIDVDCAMKKEANLIEQYTLRMDMSHSLEEVTLIGKAVKNSSERIKVWDKESQQIKQKNAVLHIEYAALKQEYTNAIVLQKTYGYMISQLKYIPDGACLVGIPQDCTISGMITVGKILYAALESDSTDHEANSAADKFLEIAEMLFAKKLPLYGKIMKDKIKFAIELLNNAFGVSAEKKSQFKMTQ